MTANIDVSQALSVSMLSAAIKNCLEGAFPHVIIQGEISNCKLQHSGHWYFTLKDAQAQIASVMFRGEASSLAFSPQNGDKVVLEGSLNVYPPGGRYQIVVRKMQKQGLGELLLKLEELKRIILQRGWFKKEHKKPLPFLPQSIGVITSPTGAVIQDILNILNRRGCKFHLILNPVKVQGEGAAEEISRAIRYFNERLHVDVIILGRGGGSLEDLWCFNEEIVAEAIFHSRIPIICAVGHETDHTIAEYVADQRAPTPSAAAELVMAERIQLQKQLDNIQKQIQQTVQHQIRTHKQQLTGILRHPCFISPYHLLGPFMQKLDELRFSFERILPQKFQQYKIKLSHYSQLLATCDPRSKFKHYRQKTLDLSKSLDRAIQSRIALKNQKLDGYKQTLQAIDPTLLLSKGFSVLFAEKDGSVITSTENVSVGDRVRVRLAKGTLEAIIDKVEK